MAQHCDNLCQQRFSEYPEGSLLHYWDVWSVHMLGYKTMRRNNFTPCQERCIQRKHYECSVKNWKDGDGEMYEYNGRVPITRITIVEEIASAFFSLASAITVTISLLMYIKVAWRKGKGDHMPITVNGHTPSNYKSLTQREQVAASKKDGFPFRWIVAGYLGLSTFAAYSATLFHIKDTPMTEKMDYYSALVALLWALYMTTLRVFWLDTMKEMLSLGTLLFLYTCYHLHYMHYIVFDYGYNMKVLVITNLTEGVLQYIWLYHSNHPNRKWLFALRTTIILGAVFEMVDFAPVFGFIDGHAFWHLIILFMQPLARWWFIRDAEFFTGDKKTH
ncbi:hypothetical protein PROFUN_06321 [Planoprotostelium fungivorum]|uniref:Post-GPI attachment to proteins factor 3 n=1 Tax=Planoprotostelium fungivorum TaxID=1890364 RepID=A0A2P6NP32_9EUKA|nr:hypothetical protein PROFUN_06321 [Planoprotostelium fungivorum]